MRLLRCRPGSTARCAKRNRGPGSSEKLMTAGGCSLPLASGPLMSWGEPGRGEWVTIYTNPGHVFMEVAGIRFDPRAAPRSVCCPSKVPIENPRLKPAAGCRLIPTSVPALR